MSGKNTLKNFKAMLADAKLPEKSVEICLRGDLVAEFEEAERRLEKAQAQAFSSLDGGGDLGAIAEEIEAVQARMAEHVYEFRLRAMPKPKFRAMVAQHPPRRDPEDNGFMEPDKYLGVNAMTFFNALLRESIVDPELDEEDWPLLLDEKLTDKQYDALSDAAWFLNRGDVDVPFSRAASRISRSSETE